jgi:hypothetical protein
VINASISQPDEFGTSNVEGPSEGRQNDAKGHTIGILTSCIL